MGETVPVGADDHMPDGLVIQVGHENVAVLATAVAGELIRVDAVAFAVGGNQVQRPVLDLFIAVGTGIGAHFKAEIVAPYIRRETLVGQAYRDVRVLGVHNQMHEKSFFPVVDADTGLQCNPSWPAPATTRRRQVIAMFAPSRREAAPTATGRLPIWQWLQVGRHARPSRFHLHE